MKYYVGIDIGGTKIAYGLFDEKRNLLQKKQTASDDKNEAEQFSGGRLSEIQAESGCADCDGQRLPLRSAGGIQARSGKRT